MTVFSSRTLRGQGTSRGMWDVRLAFFVQQTVQYLGDMYSHVLLATHQLNCSEFILWYAALVNETG